MTTEQHEPTNDEVRDMANAANDIARGLASLLHWCDGDCVGHDGGPARWRLNTHA